MTEDAGAFVVGGGHHAAQHVNFGEEVGFLNHSPDPRPTC